MGIHIRSADPGDGLAVARIYEPYVLETPITFEEVPPTAEEMAGRIADLLPRYPFLVAEVDGRLVGYACASPHRVRASYRWSVDVAVYVERDWQRRGIGVALYGHLLPVLADQGYTMAYAGITLPNPASVGLHKRMGFQLLGVYRNEGFKLGHWLDVGWFARQLVDRLPGAPGEPRGWR